MEIGHDKGLTVVWGKKHDKKKVNDIQICETAFLDTKCYFRKSSQ